MELLSIENEKVMTEKTPLRCFKCGSGKWAIYRIGEGDYQVACRYCGCRGVVAHTEQLAIEGWNGVLRPEEFLIEDPNPSPIIGRCIVRIRS